MPWMRLKFAAGMNRDASRYAADGSWYDGSLVRFRGGYPEAWAGWVKVRDDFQMEGMCRSIHKFTSLEGFSWTGLGTSKRFYMISDDLSYDVTPIEEVQALAANPIATTIGSPVIVVTDVAHGHLPGDAVIISGSTDVGGILAATINAEHVISGYVNDDSYEITVGTNATSTVAAGGGASVVATYLYHAGSDDQFQGGGWGGLGWGEEEWGGDPSLGAQDKMGFWSQDNWGEDLVANANKGPIFYWDRTTPSTRMVNIRDLAGADGNAPSQSEFIIISHRDRHLIAFGCNEFGSGDFAPMTVRWCSQEDITDWDEASTVGTAGSLPFSNGSKFLCAMPTNREILVWTDSALFSLQYLGAPLIYGAELIEEGADIAGLNAVCNVGDVVYWMGRSGFYVYTGRVEKIPSTVWDYVAQNMDWSQYQKIFASTNKRHNEIIWFYPCIGGAGENDSYVAYNVVDSTWTFGTLARTAWTELESLSNPIAASPDGYLYEHENTSDDGSTNPATPLNAYIESAPLELSSEGSFDKGDRFMLVRRILPDVTFRNYDDGAHVPRMNIVLTMMDKPGGGYHSTSSSQVSRSVIVPVEEFTDDAHVRLRGRALVLRAESNSLGTQWKLGVPRIDVRPDGQR